MHELPATQGMLDVALEAARGLVEDGPDPVEPPRIREIHLVVGELTSIVDDSVQFYFDIIARGTAAEGATLVFRREPARLRCLACGHREEVVPPLAPACPACDSLRLEVAGGRAFRVESLEVDDVPPTSPPTLAGVGADGASPPSDPPEQEHP